MSLKGTIKYTYTLINVKLLFSGILLILKRFYYVYQLFCHTEKILVNGHHFVKSCVDFVFGNFPWQSYSLSWLVAHIGIDEDKRTYYILLVAHIRIDAAYVANYVLL